MTLEHRITEALLAPPAPEAGTALDLRVRVAIDGTPRRRGRRAWVTRGLVLAGMLAIAVPSVIVGGILLTESPNGLAGATEFAAEIEAAKLAVPLPPGGTWPAFLSPDPNASYSRGGGLPTVESVATCIWFGEWLDARAAGDKPREAVAAATIADIPTWRSWNSHFFDQSYRDHQGRIIAAPVEAEMDLNCGWVRDEEGPSRG